MHSKTVVVIVLASINTSLSCAHLTCDWWVLKILATVNILWHKTNETNVEHNEEHLNEIIHYYRIDQLIKNSLLKFC